MKTTIDRDELIGVIQHFAEMRGGLMLDGDSFGIDYVQIDELVDEIFGEES